MPPTRNFNQMIFKLLARLRLPLVAAFCLAISPAPRLFSQTQRSPIGADAFYKRGREAFKTGDFRTAIDCFSAALDRQLDKHEARFNRALAYIETEQWTRAAADLDQYLAQNPTEATALEKRGDVAFQLEKPDDAAKFYSRALFLGESARLHTNRGLAFLGSRNMEKAFLDFQEAIRLDSTDRQAWLGLANTFLEIHDFGQAAKIFQVCLADRATDSKNRFNFGIALAELGRFEEAISQFSLLLESGPDAEVLARRAYCFFRLGNFEQARADAVFANNLDVRNSFAYNTLAHLELQQEHFALAERIFSEALEWDNFSGKSYAGRGYARYKKRDYAAALDDLNAAIQLDPGRGEHWYVRACIRLMLDDRLGACRDYQDALKIGYDPFTEEDSTVFCEGLSEGLEPKTRE